MNDRDCSETTFYTGVGLLTDWNLLYILTSTFAKCQKYSKGMEQEMQKNFYKNIL